MLKSACFCFLMINLIVKFGFICGAFQETGANGKGALVYGRIDLLSLLDREDGNQDKVWECGVTATVYLERQAQIHSVKSRVVTAEKGVSAKDIEGTNQYKMEVGCGGDSIGAWIEVNTFCTSSLNWITVCEFAVNTTRIYIENGKYIQRLDITLEIQKDCGMKFRFAFAATITVCTVLILLVVIYSIGMKQKKTEKWIKSRGLRRHYPLKRIRSTGVINRAHASTV
mmetsp:Transcript_10798/g.19531  ORF Transcript_10798/g.19531 Transcript_10798/m.19531 type:complete len:227 (-) Transcript_10798:429-1109(-)